MRRMYSKSGVMLPMTRPVADIHFRGKRMSGNTIAGCEKVKGIVPWIEGNNIGRKKMQRAPVKKFSESYVSARDTL